MAKMSASESPTGNCRGAPPLTKFALRLYPFSEPPDGAARLAGLGGAKGSLVGRDLARFYFA
jgi:hypothetical protein